jgi:hypothetical protein
MTQVPWRRSVKQHPGEVIASLFVRLAPKGLLTPAEFMKYHFNRNGLVSPTEIGTDSQALKELALIGNFDVELLYQAMWTIVGSLTEFLGRKLPQGWFRPETRRLAPGIMKSDGDDPWVRNDWQIRGLSCDCDTGELIIERSVNCHGALTWVRVQNVYSCALCKYDQRLAKPRYVTSDTLAKSRALRSYLKGDTSDLPTELVALEDHEFLSFICWLPYFAAIPDYVLVRPSPQEAATGFSMIKRWPRCFDGTVDELLTRYGAPDLVDDIWRMQVLEEALVALGRVGSKAAQQLLEARLLSRLSISGFNERNSGFMEPVVNFSSAAQRFDWPSPIDIEAIRSSQERTRRRPPSASS